MSEEKAVAGIFVGGRGARMGGRAKGLLAGPDGRPLASRLCEVAAPLAEVVLVGEASAYAALGVPSIADQPVGIGPLGGLIALLAYASDRTVLTLACDMPWVSRGLLRCLLRAASGASIVAPRLQGVWEPLCARYDPSRTLPLAMEHAARGVTSLQRLLEAAQSAPLPESAYDAAELRDWDTPEDAARNR